MVSIAHAAQAKKIVTDLWCQLCLTFMVDQEINESCQPGFLHFIKLSHTLLDQACQAKTGIDLTASDCCCPLRHTVVSSGSNPPKISSLDFSILFPPNFSRFRFRGLHFIHKICQTVAYILLCMYDQSISRISDIWWVFDIQPQDKLRQEEDVATAGYHVFMDYEAVKLGIHWSQFSITN